MCFADSSQAGIFPGQHQVKVLYWRYQGTPSVRLTYSGEDTAGSKWGVASGMNDADSGGGTQTQRAPRFEVSKVAVNAALVRGRIL
jgi:hypothetical protein